MLEFHLEISLSEAKSLWTAIRNLEVRTVLTTKQRALKHKVGNFIMESEKLKEEVA